jgi:hypothetical protein
MPRVSIALFLLILLAACSGHQQSAGSDAQVSAPLQCGKDTDCKGNRICEGGKCVSPATSQPAVAARVAAADPTGARPEDRAGMDPIPACGREDSRIRIPVWRPSVDEHGNLSSDPPQKDGQVVYIELYHDASKVECEEDELNAFSRPKNPKDIMAGGLAVNLRGNTQSANGICYFRGYYMNEDVMGMHQGWMETYFGAVEKQKVMMSDKYCLAEKVE